jgi:hypothetical protein
MSTLKLESAGQKNGVLNTVFFNKQERQLGERGQGEFWHTAIPVPGRKRSVTMEIVLIDSLLP